MDCSRTWKQNWQGVGRCCFCSQCKMLFYYYNSCFQVASPSAPCSCPDRCRPSVCKSLLLLPSAVKCISLLCRTSKNRVTCILQGRWRPADKITAHRQKWNLLETGTVLCFLWHSSRYPKRQKLVISGPGSPLFESPRLEATVCCTGLNQKRNLFIPSALNTGKKSCSSLEGAKMQSESPFLFSLLVAFERVKLWISIAWTGHMWTSSNPTDPVPEGFFVCGGSTHRSEWKCL